MRIRHIGVLSPGLIFRLIVAANAAGGKAELLVLPDIGIKGNTHMLMQDDNNLDIADILLDWIGKHVTASAQ